MRSTLITGDVSDDIVMSDLARIGSALRPGETTEAQMTYARGLLLWITEADDESMRNRRFTAIRQAFSNWARSSLPGQELQVILGEAEKILAFLNTELRTEGTHE